jgi:hypothetical protein
MGDGTTVKNETSQLKQPSFFILIPSSITSFCSKMAVLLHFLTFISGIWLRMAEYQIMMNQNWQLKKENYPWES